MRVGAVPCFVDVDENGLVDLGLADEALSRSTSRTYFVPVHLYGRSLNLRQLRGVAKAQNVCVIEDCAQAIGATSDGIPVGTVGEAAALSFYPTKNMGCLGDGGALLTNNKDIARRASALRNYGQSGRYIHDHFGLNSRLDELQAQIMLSVLLPRLAGWNERRSAIARTYCERISNAGLTIPPLEPRGTVWHLFPVLVRDGRRVHFQAHLESHGVNTGIHYPTLIPDQEALRAYGSFEILTPLSMAQLFATQQVSLPIHPYLTDAEIETVVDACNSWGPQ